MTPPPDPDRPPYWLGVCVIILIACAVAGLAFISGRM
jgi:hypothetical protein